MAHLRRLLVDLRVQRVIDRDAGLFRGVEHGPAGLGDRNLLIGLAQQFDLPFQLLDFAVGAFENVDRLLGGPGAAAGLLAPAATSAPLAGIRNCLEPRLRFFLNAGQFLLALDIHLSARVQICNHLLGEGHVKRVCPQGVVEIDSPQRTSRTHLVAGIVSRDLRPLCRHGLLTFQRGNGRHTRLQRSHQLIGARDGIAEINACHGGRDRAGRVGCAIHRVFTLVSAFREFIAMHRALGSATCQCAHFRICIARAAHSIVKIDGDLVKPSSLVLNALGRLRIRQQPDKLPRLIDSQAKILFDLRCDVFERDRA